MTIVEWLREAIVAALGRYITPQTLIDGYIERVLDANGYPVAERSLWIDETFVEWNAWYLREGLRHGHSERRAFVEPIDTPPVLTGLDWWLDVFDQSRDRVSTQPRFITHPK